MSDAELLREWYTETPEDKIHPWEDLNEADFYFVRAKAVNNALDQLATLTQERDALRASLANLVRDGNWLLTHLGDDGMTGETAALDFGLSLEESEKLLTPSGEAGKGGRVCG